MNKIKKLCPIYFLFLMLIGCSSENKGSVKLEVLSKKIHYYKTSDYKKSINIRSINYNNISNSLKAYNILNWKIKNNTDYDYFFLLEYDKLSYTENDFFPSQWIKFEIVNSNAKNIPSRSGQPLKRDSLYFKYMDSYIDLKVLNEKIKECNNIERPYTNNNYFILKSGEERLFTSTVYLPILEEPTIQNDFYCRLIDLKKEDYKFSIHYYSNYKMYKDFLTKEDLEYLQQNNLKPFVGKIKSNQIDLTPK